MPRLDSRTPPVTFPHKIDRSRNANPSRTHGTPIDTRTKTPRSKSRRPPPDADLNLRNLPVTFVSTGLQSFQTLKAQELVTETASESPAGLHSLSPSEDSSDDVLVFKGRRRGEPENIRRRSRAGLGAETKTEQTDMANENWSRSPLPDMTHSRLDWSFLSLSKRSRVTESSELDESLQDYLSNMLQSCELDPRDVSTLAPQALVLNDKSTKTSRKDHNNDPRAAISPAILSTVKTDATSFQPQHIDHLFFSEGPSSGSDSDEESDQQLDDEPCKGDSMDAESRPFRWGNDIKASTMNAGRKPRQRVSSLLSALSGTDLLVKFPSGMTRAQLVQEMESFLLSDSGSLALPPMNATHRKEIHIAAHLMKLTSKSIGGGDHKRVRIHRTLRTVPFTEPIVQRALSHLRMGTEQGRVSKGRGTAKAASVSIPEIIPEIGENNKGHVMLQRMGWSLGTPLGSLDNQGIMHPLTLVARKGNAGLGLGPKRKKSREDLQSKQSHAESKQKQWTRESIVDEGDYA